MEYRARPREPHMTQRVVAQGLLRGNEFVLLDVGCSGGIDKLWRAFGDQLKGVGFDPLENECRRLEAEEAAQFRYVPAWITDGGHLGAAECEEIEKHPNLSKDNRFEDRTSTQQYAEANKEFSMERLYNSNIEELKYSEEKCSLDQWVAKNSFGAVDFIKIDTDGTDFGVLLGAEQLVRSSVLGVRIESNYAGSCHPYSNTFSNIDMHLRRRGYSLYDLDFYPYTRTALPGQFCHHFPAQTYGGQVKWGDALFIRDLGQPDYSTRFGFEVTPHTVLKAACLFEVFNLQDCAAEALMKYRDIVMQITNVDELLNDLTPALHGCELSHSEYLRRFKECPKLFFPFRADQPPEGYEQAGLPVENLPPPRDDIDNLCLALFRTRFRSVMR